MRMTLPSPGVWNETPYTRYVRTRKEVSVRQESGGEGEPLFPQEVAMKVSRFVFEAALVPVTVMADERPFHPERSHQ